MKLNKQTFIGAAGLGAGALGARFVGNNLLKNQSAIVKNLVPVAGGLFLSGKTGIIGDVGKGMVANGLADLIASFIDKDGALGLSGVSPNTMLGYIPGVDYQEVGTDNPMMGATDNISSNFDYTSGSAGEMDY